MHLITTYCIEMQLHWNTTAYMTIVFQYNCSKNTATPTVIDHNSVSRSDTCKNLKCMKLIIIIMHEDNQIHYVNCLFLYWSKTVLK